MHEAVAVKKGVNVFTVDVEDWNQIRCEDALHYLLDLCDAKNQRGTFFVLGTLAHARPEVVRLIHDRGHRVGSHAWQHVHLTRLTRDEFAEDMRRATGELSDITGEPVLSFRAPFFSVVDSSWWALDVLKSVGIRYDSSIFPFAGSRYGMPGFPRHPVRIREDGSSIVELPLSTVALAGRNLPVSGGGYFRLLPYPLIRRAVERVNNEGMPFVIYCHPYEFEARRLRLFADASPYGPWWQFKNELKQNMFRRSMRGKLDRLMSTTTYVPIEEAFTDEH